MQETRETIWLKHPHKGDPVEVEATPEAMTPFMAQGYQRCDPQKQPARPAEGE